MIDLWEGDDYNDEVSDDVEEEDDIYWTVWEIYERGIEGWWNMQTAEQGFFSIMWIVDWLWIMMMMIETYN